MHPSLISKHATPAARPVPLSELPLAATAASIPVPAEPPAVAPLATVTKAAIERALAVHDGDMTATAEALGVSRSGLYKMCERYGIPMRLEGIDAPELHYQSSSQPQGSSARDALLAWLGVDAARDGIAFLPDGATIRSPALVGVPVTVLANAVEPHGRIIA